MSYSFGFQFDEAPQPDAFTAGATANATFSSGPSGSSGGGLDLNPDGTAECTIVGPPMSMQAINSLSFVPADYPAMAAGASGAVVSSRPLQLLRVDVVTHDSNDLVPGVYEGGLKLWESSVDLLDYFAAHFDAWMAARTSTSSSSGTSTTTSNSSSRHAEGFYPPSVIELGCGHGLPGLAALAKGCSPVLFSDFNEEVLREVTWPNIIRNTSIGLGRSSSALCIAGDWARLSHNLTQGRYECEGASVSQFFDIILSAETLYCQDSCCKVFAFIARHLKPGGIALIATKRYYFGVGGGSYSFMDLIQKQLTPLLTAQIVAVFEDGSSNIREIISVTKTSPI